MEKVLPLYLGPSVIGSLTISGSDDSAIRLFATTYTSIEGIWRAYVKTNDKTLLVGVLSPKGQCFEASRELSRETLRIGKIRANDITYAFAKRSQEIEGSAWKTLSEIPEIFCRCDEVCALANSTGARFSDEEDELKLAVPFFTGRPFPRPDLLCLMTPIRISGELFGAFRVSSDGLPKRL